MSRVPYDHCTGCGLPADEVEFYMSKGRRAQPCKDCIRQVRREAYHALSLEQRRMFGGYSLERRYGITKAERDAMFEAQDGKCVICGGEGGSRGLVVDHDHETMQVRDLLCNRCNVAVGVIESKLFEVFLEYIAYHKGGELTIGETQT